MIVLEINAFMGNVLIKLIRTNVSATLVTKEKDVIKVRKRGREVRTPRLQESKFFARIFA